MLTTAGDDAAEVADTCIGDGRMMTGQYYVANRRICDDRAVRGSVRSCEVAWRS